mmetsp:Transcript_21072/g.32159  ORF Transcript_21072/g.32159 Transcript_21072/m.32159 type:complete len:698 (+) Transcript_21072:211-2304(+)|eukprot:CAMPEP_0196804670 /NCGR_PEP_ID=MMETSP1362-20130617/4331_1 /TAXON_ID=163516 /ORGANISM="Leptocylindrus danicus, Strain CCMP1856" /LENGTH=697 /DNA_ID=CAMNT_0042177127 /DNA_START=132 /DNA_END=2225 /DNA_ORIENTATION=+
MTEAAISTHTGDNEWPDACGLAGVTSDLFSSDLFGDELTMPAMMDIDHASPCLIASNAAITPASLSLNSSAKTKSGSGTKRKNSDDFGLNLDGLGALRPSTSFNDFAHLLPPTNADEVGSSGPAGVAIASKAASGSSNEKLKKKSVASGKKSGVPASTGSKSIVAATTANTVVAKKVTKPKAKKTVVKSLDAKGVTIKTPNPLPSLPKFNGIGKKTETAPVKVKVESSFPGPSAVIELSPGAVTTPALVKSSTVGLAPSPSITSNAVATAAAAAANLLLKTNSTASLTPSDTDGSEHSIITPPLAMASTGYSFKESKDTGDFPIPDTSTDHVHALTSSNWVAACSASGVANFGASGQTTLSQVQANKRRRQNLTADERAKQNRDRNREHARNTRLRKKAYVEELKRTLTELVTQRDSVALERKRAAQREAEQREVRFRVLEEFLKLRGANEASEAKWKAILEDGFKLILPATSYREMVHTTTSPGRNNIARQVTSEFDADKVTNCLSSNEQILCDVKEVMADAALVAGLLEVMGRGTSGGDEVGKVHLSYKCDKSRFMMDGVEAVVSWTAQSVGAVNRGSTDELYCKGSARASFSATSNKLISVELMFDTGSVVAQLSTVFPHFASLDDHALSVADADALLDSINVPHIRDLHSVSASEQSDAGVSSDETGVSSDETDDVKEKKVATVKTRRSMRRQ